MFLRRDLESWGRTIISHYYSILITFARELGSRCHWDSQTLTTPPISVLQTDITMSKSILLINGPNLNLLGTREPQIHGYTTLAQVESESVERAKSLGAELQTFQSNTEGAIVDRIHAARGNVDFIIINPGAYTHTSVAIRDALAGVDIPFIELHISNTHTRESFRHHSYLSDKAVAVILGLGIPGYGYAIDFAVNNFKKKA